MGDFEVFWARWPRKTAKADARVAWEQVKKIRPPIEVVLAAIDAHMAWRQQLANARDFVPSVPYPASWLRGERWADEFDTPEVAQTSAPMAAPAAATVQQQRESDVANAAREKAAAEAFAELLAVVRNGGQLPIFGFGDSRIDAALKPIGGAQWLRSASEDDLRAARGQFIHGFKSAPIPAGGERAQVVSISSRRVA